MSETEEELKRRLTELEQRLRHANNRSVLILLLVLLSGGVNLWLALKPLREVRLADGSSTAVLTPRELRITDSTGAARVNTLMIRVEEAGGKPLAGVGNAPGRGGYLALTDPKEAGPDLLTVEGLTKLTTALAKAEAPDGKQDSAGP
jgi:hypothetical protein